MKSKKIFSFTELIKRLLTYLWLLFTLTTVFVPLLWMINASFSPGAGALDLKKVSIIPNFEEYSLRHFENLITYKSTPDQVMSDYLESFWLTLQVALLTMVLIVVMSILIGFAFSRFRFKGRKQAMMTVLSLQMFPSFMGMLALFLLFQTLGLLDNHLALAFIYTAGAIPINAFIFRGYMRNIPMSLDEAARIDGASNIQLITKILIPLAKPIIGFIAVTAFVAPWMDYILPSVLLSDNETVALWLMPLANPMSMEYNPLSFFAGALALTVPIMIVQIYFQKFIVGGVTAGAEKG